MQLKQIHLNKTLLSFIKNLESRCIPNDPSTFNSSVCNRQKLHANKSAHIRWKYLNNNRRLCVKIEQKRPSIRSGLFFMHHMHLATQFHTHIHTYYAHNNDKFTLFIYIYISVSLLFRFNYFSPAFYSILFLFCSFKNFCLNGRQAD